MANGAQRLGVLPFGDFTVSLQSTHVFSSTALPHENKALFVLRSVKMERGNNQLLL